MLKLTIVLTLLALGSRVLGKGKGKSSSKTKSESKSVPPPDTPLDLTISTFESSDCKNLVQDVRLLQKHKHLISNGPDTMTFNSYQLSRDMKSDEEIKFSDGRACDGHTKSTKRKLKAKGRNHLPKCNKVKRATVSPLCSSQILNDKLILCAKCVQAEVTSSKGGK